MVVMMVMLMLMRLMVVGLVGLLFSSDIELPSTFALSRQSLNPAALSPKTLTQSNITNHEP